MFQVTTILPKSGLVKHIPQKDRKIDYGSEFFKKVDKFNCFWSIGCLKILLLSSNVYTFRPTLRA